MEALYKVVTDGKLREGISPEQFISTFVQTFKVPEEQARKLLTTTRPLVLKDNLDRETADKIQRVLMGQMGLEVRIEVKEMPGLMSDGDLALEGQSDSPASTAATASADSTVRCPKCGSDRVVGDECLACGVIISRYRERQAQMHEEASSFYAPPNSKVLPDREVRDDDELNLRKVETGEGWQWIVGGWQLFVRNPVAWIVALVIWYVIIFVAGLIPVIGSLGVNILSPVFMAGLMLGAREQQEGGDFTINHLFAGFSTEFGKLVQAGLLYLAGSVVAILIGAVLFALTGLGIMANHANNASFDGGVPIGSILVLIVIVATIMVLLAMAFYFAPLLIVFEGLGPIEAVKMSFSACWKNAMPFLIYGLILFGLGLLAIIPFGLGFFVLAPVMVASIYVSYRSIFHNAA